MKRYFVTVNYGKLHKSSGSYPGQINVFKLIKGDLKWIGEKKFTTGMTKGADAECMDVLLSLKEITRKDYQFSKCSRRGEGYYDQDNGKFTIKVLF